MDIEDARGRLYQLHLEKVVDKDPDQDVEGWAVPFLDEVLRAIKGVFRHDEPAVARLQDVMSPEAAAAGSVRAFDLYLIVGQLYAALPPQQLGGLDLYGD